MRHRREREPHLGQGGAPAQRHRRLFGVADGVRGQRLVRWAAIEAIQRVHGGAIGATRARLAERRGANIAKVAAARKLFTLVYYGLRDGHLRSLAKSECARSRRSQHARSPQV